MDHGRAQSSASPFGAAKWIWGLIFVCLCADVLIKLGVGLAFKIQEIAAVIAIVVAALGLSAFYTVKRQDERIARLFRAGVELFLLTFLVGSLSYSATSLNRPLWDEMYHGWDQVIGFDWRYWLSVLDANKNVHRILALAYHSMWPQLTLIVISLVTVRDFRRLDVFLLAFGFSAIITVIISGLMPAMSPLAYLQITPADHPHINLAVPREFEEQALALRAGVLRVVELGDAQGLVTFPSFHTVTAVLLLLAFRSVPYMRWVSLAANTLMLFSIPIEGSHYLVDVIAGIAVALVAWMAAAAAVNVTTRSRLPLHQTTPAYPA